MSTADANGEGGAEPEQLALALPHRPALEAEDFFISACNEAAVAMIDAWPDWPGPAALLIGPPGSGKTHLAHVWRQKSGAVFHRASAVSMASLAGLADGRAVIVEDADSRDRDEHALFHLLNLAREQGFGLLFTASTPPVRWDMALPDLRSRVLAMSVIAIEPPDDDLLKVVLVKQFADRQLAVQPSVIEFIFTRMERSMEAARRLVDLMDSSALAAGRKVSRPLAAKILDQFDADKS